MPDGTYRMRLVKGVLTQSLSAACAVGTGAVGGLGLRAMAISI